MSISDQFTPDVQDGSAPASPVPVQKLADDGAITIAAGIVFLSKLTASAITIDAPPAGMTGARLLIVSASAAAHTVTHTPGFLGGTTSNDVATFGGAVGDLFELVAYNGAWLAVNLNNVTLG